MDQQRMSVSQFGSKPANYLMSAVHATGADLERLKAMASQIHPNRALDLGCGAGHVSFALAHGGAPPSHSLRPIYGNVGSGRTSRHDARIGADDRHMCRCGGSAAI